MQRNQVSENFEIKNTNFNSTTNIWPIFNQNTTGSSSFAAISSLSDKSISLEPDEDNYIKLGFDLALEYKAPNKHRFLPKIEVEQSIATNLFYWQPPNDESQRRLIHSNYGKNNVLLNNPPNNATYSIPIPEYVMYTNLLNSRTINLQFLNENTGFYVCKIYNNSNSATGASVTVNIFNYTGLTQNVILFNGNIISVVNNFAYSFIVSASQNHTFFFNKKNDNPSRALYII